MAYQLPPKRPWVSMHSTSSNSLNGMEIPMPKPLPFPGKLTGSTNYFSDGWDEKPLPPIPGNLPVFTCPFSDGLSGKSLPPTPGKLPGSTGSSLDRLHEKPLHPTPRRPSSAYTMRNDETMEGWMRNNADLPPVPILQPTIYSLSTSRVPTVSGVRPPLLRGQEAHAISDPIIERRRAQREDLADLGIHSSELLVQYPTTDSPTQSVPRIQRLLESNSQIRDANEQASNYESVLHTRSSIERNYPNEPYSNHDYSPSSMSPRITDVVDQSLVPPPLRYNTVVKDSQPSTLSSNDELFQSSTQNSVRAYIREALHARRPSPAAQNRKKAAANPTNLSDHPAPPTSRHRYSVTGQRRGSIQQGLSHMYTSIRKLSLTTTSSSLPKLPTTRTNKKKPRLPRELRSPAIPITPYQRFGTKAWEQEQPPSSRRSHKHHSSRLLGSGTTTSNHFFPSFSSSSKQRKKNLFLSSRSPVVYHGDDDDEEEEVESTPPVVVVGNKIATAFYKGAVQVKSKMGLNTNTERHNKLSKAELRREELKRKIVVLGLGE